MIREKTNMVIYHGTASKFQVPDINYTRGQKDFGKGFYTTTDKAQAEQFARIQSRRGHCNIAYVNQYYISNFNGLNVLEFSTADENWLKFICNNRGKQALNHTYDVIIGKIADDDTRVTLEQYIAGLFAGPAKQLSISPEQFAINILKTDKLKNQLCLCTQNAISRLNFIRATVVR